MTTDPRTLTRSIRRRLDFFEDQDGGITAVVTFRLPNGRQLRYRARAVPADVAAYRASIARAEQRLGGNVGNILDDLWDGAKDVWEGVKDVAKSKAFKAAADGLQIVAPALGPFAPAATGVATGMKVANGLALAADAASKGAPKTAAAAVAAAQAVAAAPQGVRLGTREAFPSADGTWRTATGTVVTRSPDGLYWEDQYQRNQREQWAALGNEIRKATAETTRKATPKPVERTADGDRSRSEALRAGPSKRVNVLAAARRGVLRSNRRGPVKPSELLAAEAGGRVFFIAAS